jgi:L-seryl-tRNA(Ser) seleniumtransferase
MHRFLDEPAIAAYAARFGATVVKATVDDVLVEARAGIGRRGQSAPDFDELVARVRERLGAREDDELVPVLNATGVLLHTNLGRGPLAPEALEAAAAVAGGYSNLEFDLETGARGSRYARVAPLLCTLCGAGDALVVNNGAAAVLLVLDTFAKGREVVVARGELIEIGGGFRLPDVLARSGASLVEVGTTNKVYVRDYERALTPRSALLMRSHPSNFRITGFTAGVPAQELAALGKRAGVPSLEDLGSGALVGLEEFGLPHERTVRDAVADGIDLVTFSGDKLLGGPQAGLIVGSSSAVARLRANPLLRALRVGKATLAELAATLRLYLEPGGLRKIPLYAMLAATPADLERRARALAAGLGPSVRACETVAYAGGGAAPLARLPSWGVAIGSPHDAGATAKRLREARPRTIARIDGGDVVLDLRAVPAASDGDLRAALVAALAERPPLDAGETLVR